MENEHNGSKLPVGESDYDPGLAAWKPLEAALGAACLSDGEFTANSHINALRSILPPGEVDSLHNLRLIRNKLVHHEDVWQVSQSGMGVTRQEFTEKCARLTQELYKLSQSERERAHNALISGIDATTPEEKAWSRFVACLRKRTSQRTAFECIDALADRAPTTFLNELHELRMSWKAIYLGETEKNPDFVVAVNTALASLADPDQLLKEKLKEDDTRAEQMMRKRWPGAGDLAGSVDKAWNSFSQWFTSKGGRTSDFHNSINEIAGKDTELRDTLHSIRILKNQLAHEPVVHTDLAKEFIKLCNEVHADDTKQEARRKKFHEAIDKGAAPPPVPPTIGGMSCTELGFDIALFTSSTIFCLTAVRILVPEFQLVTNVAL